MTDAPVNLWAWWQRALAGQKQPVVMGEPQQGYFRYHYTNKRTGEVVDDAVAIWMKDGAWWGKRGGDAPFSGTDRVYDLFERCAKRPVTYAAYGEKLQTGRWPTDLPAEAAPRKPAPAEVAPKPAPVEPPAAGHNSAAADIPQLEAIRDEIESAWTAFDTWLKTIHEITTQEQADLAGTYADRFTKLERQADQQRETEKKPHLEAGRKVDAAWKPVLHRADAGKRFAKDKLGDFMRAEAKRRQQAADEANRKRLAEITPFDDPSDAPPAVEPVKVTVGGGERKVTLVKVKRVRITDIEKVKAAFMSTPAGENAAREWAERVGPAAPIAIPGTEQFEEQVAR